MFSHAGSDFGRVGLVYEDGRGEVGDGIEIFGKIGEVVEEEGEGGVGGGEEGDTGFDSGPDVVVVYYRYGKISLHRVENGDGRPENKRRRRGEGKKRERT